MAIPKNERRKAGERMMNQPNSAAIAHYSYMVNPRAVLAGGGWEVCFIAHGLAVGGALFPAQEGPAEVEAFLKATECGDQWLLSKAMAPGESTLSEAEFLAKHLTRVAKLAGVTVPEGTYEQTAGVAGTILGQIARVLECRKARDWPAAERIANLPDVDEALRGFSEDPTGDNGTAVVSAILSASATTPAAEGEDEPHAIKWWSGEACPLPRLLESLRDYSQIMPADARAQWAMREAAAYIESITPASAQDDAKGGE